MVASAVFITDLQGKSIINRNYRGDVPLTRAIERFAKYLADTPDEAKKPIFQADACGDFFVEEDVGCTGNDGETYVYISVRDVKECWRRRMTEISHLCFYMSYVALQSLSLCRNDSQLQRGLDPDFPLSTLTSIQRLLWPIGRREYSRQLCHYLRITGRNDGSRRSAIVGQYYFAELHYDGCESYG